MYSMVPFSHTMARDDSRRSKSIFTLSRRAIPRGDTDKLIIIRPVLSFMLKWCRTIYVPLKNFSIDEVMLKWKGHLSIKVYNPLKPTKYGIKFYFLCEAKTSYVLDCIIYRGVTSILRDTIFRLLGDHLSKGYHVCIHGQFLSSCGARRGAKQGIAPADYTISNQTHSSPRNFTPIKLMLVALSNLFEGHCSLCNI